MSQIYKELVSFFFKIVYGKINYFHKKNKYIKIHKVKKDKRKYKIFEINNCRIYTDTVHDTAFINNNEIIDQASFQLRNLVNSNIKNNRVLKYGTPKFLKTLDSPLLCILTGGAGNNNYWHWMYDVLPRIGIVESKFALKKFKFIFVPNKEYLYQIDTLKILGILKKSVSSKKFKHIYSNKILATNHPWQYSKSAHKDISVIPKWISLWIRNKFLKFKSKKKFYDKIYIDRSDSKFNINNKRIILNEKEIRENLLKKKFKIIRLSEYNFKDQIAIFNNAKIIVGNHGAGFANLVFCKKNTKVIEFIDKNTSKPIKKISKDLGLNYFSILGKRINSDTGDQNNNLHISTKKLISILK
tara:strand:- start:521 stop:1588 length:1068 start_codon:yes stop_codon:yes gene_type:complete